MPSTLLIIGTPAPRCHRDPRVAIRAPQVGEVGGADSLEAWARPYYHQRDAEESPRAGLGNSLGGGGGLVGGGKASPGSGSLWTAFSSLEVGGTEYGGREGVVWVRDLIGVVGGAHAGGFDKGKKLRGVSSHGTLEVEGLVGVSHPISHILGITQERGRGGGWMGCVQGFISISQHFLLSLCPYILLSSLYTS